MSIRATLEQFDETLDAPAVRPASTIPNGLFTLTLPGGGHRTFRIHTKSARAKFAPGERVLSILVGPDNERDYRPFAFVSDQGIRVWKKHRGGELEGYVGPLLKLATGRAVAGYALEVSKRCLKCNRTLTTPESMVRGVGPDCWERMQHGD